MASPTAKTAALPDSQASSFPDTSITSKNRRAQALSMSFDSLKAFQPFLGSNASTPSSRYLSPPVSIADRSSPPPRREAEDYLTSGDHHASKGKHRRIREQRSHSLLISNSEDSAYTESFSSGTMPAADLEAKKAISDENRKSENIAHNAGSSLSSPVVPQPRDYSPWMRLLDSIAGPPRDALPALVSTSRKEMEDSNVSPAINALHRLSRCSTQPPDTNFMGIRRLSQAVNTAIGAVFTSQDADPAMSAENENTNFPALTNNHARNSSYKRGHRRHSAFTGDHLYVRQATPATITLRKATQTCQTLSTEASTISTPFEASQSVEPPSLLPTSTSNLLAFSSKRVGEKPASISSGFSFSDRNECIGTQSDAAARKLSFMNHHESPRMNESPTMRARSGTLPSGTTTDLGHSVLADNALTKTGVFPCFGTLINPCSKSSVVSPDRTSVIQFVSRTSVHEIIWREAESPSSGSESSVITPKKHKQTASTSQSSTKEPQTDVGGLFAWTWDHTPLAITESPGTYSSKSGVLNPSKSARLLRTCSTFSQSTASSALPRLGNRHSTSDCRRVAFADLKDPSEAKIARAATGGLETMGKGRLRR